MNENELWKLIKKKTKPSYLAPTDENGKPLNVIANKGLKENEIAVRYGAEYKDFSIKAKEYIRPIITDLRMSKAIRKLSEGNIQGAIKVLRIEKEVQSRPNGINFMYGIIQLWLNKNEIESPPEYQNKAIKITEPYYVDWVNSGTYSPILGKFEIVGIGITKTGEPVVDEDWLGRTYIDAVDLHKDMDKLEWRRGKPPVNYCCIYIMSIKKNKKWEKKKEVFDFLNNIKAKIGIKIFPVFRKNELIDLNSDIIFFETNLEKKQWIDNLPDESDIITAHLQTENPEERLILACDLDNIVIKNPQYIKKRTVGVLVSRLQKLIRRGRGCSNILKETMIDLWNSPNYNLPEQQFLRVSSNRQLTWRLLITTIEDVQAFDWSENSKYLSLNNLACLAVLANIDSDTKFTETIFEKILYTALLIQRTDDFNEKWQINNYSKTDILEKKTENPLLKSFKLLTFYMPMRQGDYEMLNQSFNIINDENFEPKLLNEYTLGEILSSANKQEEINGELAGYDMAPYPNIILILQSSLPFLPYNNNYTTKGISAIIWNYSSSINVRRKDQIENIKKLNDEIKHVLFILKEIQKNIKNPFEKKSSQFYLIKEELKKLFSNKQLDNTKIVNNKKISPKISRLAFILIFGKKTPIYFDKKKYDVIVVGDSKEPCRVKRINKNDSEFIEGEERKKIEDEYFKIMDPLNNIIIECPEAPIGYNWKWGDKKKIKIGALKRNNKMYFTIEDFEIKPFDGDKLLERLPNIDSKKKVPDIIIKLINQALYISKNIDKKENEDLNDYEINQLMVEINQFRNETENYILYDWINLVKKNTIPSEIWKNILVKFYNSFDYEIQVGPVDGWGNKLQQSIDYKYEGSILRVLNMLCWLYPNVLKSKNILQNKFIVNNRVAEYLTLIKTLKKLAFPEISSNFKKEKSSLKYTKIKATLWEHQKKAVDAAIYDFLILKKKGRGDAGDVGSGKTLTSLAIMSKLINNNIEKKEYNYKGFLVLLPTTYLYKTWEDEIKKFTEGFEIVFQSANGELSGVLNMNSILITTLGRMRDHPINNSWIFVTIDEALSVQNKSSLHTAEAYKQIISSQYGCILLSATFFRARFDKLFYMLKMLNTGLPEKKEYLDAILNESIISNIPIQKSKWIDNINKFKLPSYIRKDYDLILKQGINSEKLYVKLESFLKQNFDYISAYREIIKKAESGGRNSRCLIYGRSKQEADLIAREIKNTTRFPDITGNHLSISWTEGSYGLNQLIYLDTIVTPIPPSDLIPQMKGRLQRFGQKSLILHMEFFYLENTIDEANLFKLELANRFRSDYILPLSEFYEIAFGRKKKPKLLKED